MVQKTSTQIQITLNGATTSVREGSSLGDLLDNRGLERRMIAIEYNGEILPRRDYDATTLHTGDVLEVVHMVGGG